jgi:glutamate-1-semialdehyde 2,1-aminomutase
MTTRTPVVLDRARIAELTAREAKRLDERTAGSGALYERARKTLSAGVASSYQTTAAAPTSGTSTATG